jgi:hypothetical protein
VKVDTVASPRRDYKHVDSGSDGDGAIQGSVGRRNPGRPKGAVNKTTRAVKEAAILAAECSKHSDGTLFGYLRYMSDNYPVTFTRSILSRLIPYVLHADVQLQSVADIRAQLIARGVPLPTSLFEVPKVPSRMVAQRHLDPPLRDEDHLHRESPAPEPPQEPLPPSIFEEAPVGTQFELAWPSKVPPDNCCWPDRRPLRVVSDTNPEQTDDNAIPPPAAATAK